jgi:hypothetical protein
MDCGALGCCFEKYRCSMSTLLSGKGQGGKGRTSLVIEVLELTVRVQIPYFL